MTISLKFPIKAISLNSMLTLPRLNVSKCTWYSYYLLYCIFISFSFKGLFLVFFFFVFS